MPCAAATAHAPWYLVPADRNWVRTTPCAVIVRALEEWTRSTRAEVRPAEIVVE